MANPQINATMSTAASLSGRATAKPCLSRRNFPARRDPRDHFETPFLSGALGVDWPADSARTGRFRPRRSTRAVPPRIG